MRKPYRLIALLLFFSVLLNAAMPASALSATGQKRGPSVKRFFRWLGEKGEAVIQIPNRVTGAVPLGPVMGPLAGEWLATRFRKHPQVSKIMRRASQFEGIAKNIKFVDDARDKLKGFYRLEATEWRKMANELEAGGENLEKGILSGSDPAAAQKYVSLSRTAKAYRKMADLMDRKAESTTSTGVAKMLVSRAGKKVSNDVLCNESLGNELGKLANPEIFKQVIGGGLEPGVLFEAIAEGYARRFLKQAGFEEGPDFDALKEKLTESIREASKNNKNFYKNWKTEISKLLKTITTAGKEDEEGEREGVTESAEAGEEPETVGPETTEPSGTAENKFPFKETNVNLAIILPKADPGRKITVLGTTAFLTVTEDGKFSGRIDVQWVDNPVEGESGKVGMDPLTGLPARPAETHDVRFEITSSKITSQSETAVSFELAGTITAITTEEGKEPVKSPSRGTLTGQLSSSYSGRGKVTSNRAALFDWSTI